MQGPPLAAHQDAQESQPEQEEVQRECQRARDRLAQLASVPSGRTTRTPNTAMPNVLPLAAQE
jgi:hypothetical protein